MVCEWLETEGLHAWVRFGLDKSFGRLGGLVR